MKRLVRFCSYYSESLKKSLADAGIKYEWTQEKPDPYQPNYLIFHLDIDAPEYELILKAIDDAKLRSAPTRTESLSFTKKELDDAEWLHVRPSCKKIDPYDDVEVSKNDLSPIAKICKYILDSTLLQDYEEPDEGRQMLQDLLEIIQKAMTRDVGLVSIGD